MTKTQESIDAQLLELLVDQQHLVIYNDHVNSFDFVIDSLIKVCKHDPIQAEQCTMLIHYKGKCIVKTGDWNTLEPMCTSLLDKGITAEIE
jgi:ATP-dependent Clp protease adaptor protein ClpS